MDFFLIALVCGLTGLLLRERAEVVYSATKEFFSGIAAPSPSTPVVPSALNSTVLITEGSCAVSDFTSTLWFCPTATATATATATTTAASTPVFLPSDIPEPVTIETLAPGLPVTDLLGIAAFAALLVTLLLWFAYHLGQVKGAARPVAPPEEAPLIPYDSIMTIAYYDWFAKRKDEIQLAIHQQSENESLRSQIDANKRHGDATESAHQEQLSAQERAHKKEIDKINSAHDDELRRLHEELTARERTYGEKIEEINNASDTRERRLQEEIAFKDSAHKGDIATRERSYQKGIAEIKAKHKKSIAQVETYAHNHRRNLYYEVQKRKDAEDKWDALVTSHMFASGLPKPMAQTSPQDGAPDSTGEQLLIAPAAAVSSNTQNVAPDSTTDQLLPAPTVTEVLTTEAEEALSSEQVSPTTTPELDSAEPTAETSSQDVAPGTEDQLPSPPAAAESPITEAKDELLAETEGKSEAESANSTEHEQEEKEEEEEEEEAEEHEPRNSGMPLPEPSLMGEGAEQIPQDQEKGLAQDAPVPTEEQTATSQPIEPEAAPGPATSDDGASKAPVTTEVLPEEQTGDRETEEPTAVEESEEVRGAATSDDGASMTPVTKENGNGFEMATAGQSDQPPPVSTDQAVPDEPAEGMDLVEDSPDVASTLEWQSAAANGSEHFEEAGASESLTSLSPPDATIVELDDEMSDVLAVERKSPDDMDVDDGDGTVNHPSTEQSNSADETDGDSPMVDDSNEDAAKASESGSSNRTGEEWLGSDIPIVQSTQQAPSQQPAPRISNPLHLATHPQPPAPIAQSTQQVPSQQPVLQIGNPLHLNTYTQPPAPVVQSTQQAPPQHPVPQIAHPLFLGTNPQPVVQNTQQAQPQHPVPQIGHPLLLGTNPKPVVQNTQQAQPQHPAAQIGHPLLLGTNPQPVVQNTQQAPPQQPAAQTANPLWSFHPPSDAAREVKRWLSEYKSLDLQTVIQQMAWAADYMENRKPVSMANRVLLSCVEKIGPMHQYYKEMRNANGHDPRFASLMEDINRVYDELRKVK